MAHTSSQAVALFHRAAKRFLPVSGAVCRVASFRAPRQLGLCGRRCWFGVRKRGVSGVSAANPPHPAIPVPDNHDPSTRESVVRLKLGSQSHQNVTVVFEDGEMRHHNARVADVLAATRLHARDLNTVTMATKQPPSVLPRKGCILVALSHVRAILLRDRVVVFRGEDESASHEFVCSLSHHIKARVAKLERRREAARKRKKKRALETIKQQLSGSPMPVETMPEVLQDLGLQDLCHDASVEESELDLDDVNAFELLVMEHTLASICDKYERRVLFCAPVVETLLSGLSASVNIPDENQLQRVFPLRQSLSAFRDATVELLHSLDTLLEDDDEMSKLCLRFQRQVIDARKAGEPLNDALLQARETKWVTEVEMLLQTYHGKISHIHTTIHRLLYAIESAQDMMNIHMNNYRNHLIHVNLQLAILTTGLGMGTFVAGLFGMNLLSGLETLPGLFGWVCCGSAGLGVAFFTAYSAYSRATMPSMDRVNAVSALATQIDSLASTIQEFGYTGRSVTKLQFKESIRAYHPITDEEVDLVFAAFDSDGDGLLEYEEYVTLLDGTLPKVGPLTQVERDALSAVRGLSSRLRGEVLSPRRRSPADASVPARVGGGGRAV